MYVQVGDFCVSRGPSTVPLTRSSCNTFFSKSQNARKAGTLCNFLLINFCTHCDLLVIVRILVLISSESCFSKGEAHVGLVSLV